VMQRNGFSRAAEWSQIEQRGCLDFAQSHDQPGPGAGADLRADIAPQEQPCESSVG
jgi:hypothetical protein